MSSRHALPWWRFWTAVVAVLLAPIIGIAAFALVAGGLLVMLAGIVSLREPLVGMSGLVLVVIGLLAARLCLWALHGRRLMIRSQRVLLGLSLLPAALIASLVPVNGWHVAAVTDAVALLYALYGVAVAWDGANDRWSA